MKKKLAKSFLLLFSIFAIYIFSSSNVWAATGYAKSNYQLGENGLFHDIASIVDGHLDNMGYNATHINYSASNIRYFLDYNLNKVYYLVGHSGPAAQGCEPGLLTINIDSVIKI